MGGGAISLFRFLCIASPLGRGQAHRIRLAVPPPSTSPPLPLLGLAPIFLGQISLLLGSLDGAILPPNQLLFQGFVEVFHPLAFSPFAFLVLFVPFPLI